MFKYLDKVIIAATGTPAVIVGFGEVTAAHKPGYLLAADTVDGARLARYYADNELTEA